MFSHRCSWRQRFGDPKRDEGGTVNSRFTKSNWNGRHDKIDLLKKGKQLVYAYKNASRKSQGADNEEKLILEAVKKSGNDGIAPKDIKYATNLPQPQITKILKGMEARRLVKSVVSSSKKKLFLLYGLEPSHAVTGGTFYSGQEFETEFVDVLGEQCYRYLLQAKGLAEKLSDPVSQRHASFKSSREICDYINSLKISKVELKLPDIEKILEALIYDDKVEKSVSLTSSSSKGSGSENFYRTIKPLLSSAGLMRMPCGVCP
ncbi:DNA-directed RNA polymerase III subunit RPC6, partial [Araneus ventricosus]